MSRASHAARAERLRRQLQGEPVVKVVFAPWVLELMKRHGRAPTDESGSTKAPRPPRPAKKPER